MNTQPDARQLRGQEIAARYRITQENNLWLVPSQSGKGKYRVDLKSNKCSCPDNELKRQKCKHLFAVEYTIEQEYLKAIDGETQTQTVVEISKVKKPTYPQQWHEYNLAQTRLC